MQGVKGNKQAHSAVNPVSDKNVQHDKIDTWPRVAWGSYRDDQLYLIGFKVCATGGNTRLVL